MNQEEQLIQRLSHFFQDAKGEISATPPIWQAPGQRRGRWIQPVFASAALAAVAVSVIVGVRIFRENRAQVNVANSPTASASASAAPTVTPTPVPSPDASWVTKRFAVGAVYALLLDPSAVFSLNQSGPRVARIDRSTGAVTMGPTLPGATAMAETGAGIWTAAGPGIAPAPANSQWLRLVDSRTLIVRRQVRLPGQPGSDTNSGPQLAAASNLLWLGYGNTVSRLNPETGATLLSQIQPGTVTSVSLDPSGHRLYVGITGEQGQVIELDATSGSRIASAATGGAGLGGPTVAAASDGVWVTYATGMMGNAEHRRATNLSLMPVAPQPIPNGDAIRGSNGISISIGGNAIWLIDAQPQQLVCADPNNGAFRLSAIQTGSAMVVVADDRGAYLGDSDGVAALQPPAACRG